MWLAAIVSRTRQPRREPLALLAATLVVCTGAAAEPDRDPAEGRRIADRFLTLSRTNQWRKTGAVKLAFRTFHPQGLAIVGDRFYLSSVEVLNRVEGRGRGHLFEADFEGRLLRQIQLGQDAAYHPGGIDFDGRWLWVPVAEYQPDSRSLVYRVDPATLETHRVFEFQDHLGALVCDPRGRQLLGVSWGSRRFYRWDLLATEDAPRAPASPVQSTNSSHYVDYQDGQFLAGTSWALFGGVSRLGTATGPGFALGGLELVDLPTLRMVHQIPVPLWTARGQSMLQNPFAVVDGPAGLRCHFVPEDEDSTLYTYETE